MALDYKYANDQSGLRRNWSRRLLLFLAILLSVTITIYGLYFFKTRKTEEMILTGHYQAAIEKLNHWKWLPVVSGKVYERIGTAELLWHDRNAAAPFFQKSETGRLFRPVSFWEASLKTLWNNGRYEDGLAYSDHLLKALVGQNILHFYRAGFLGGLNQLDGARKEIQLAGNIKEFTKEISQTRMEIEQRLSTGQFTFVYDRENLPLVQKSLKGEFKLLYEPVQSILKSPGGDFLAELNQQPNRQTVLTIDYRIQNAALKALGKYAGAIVLLNTENGDILAAAGNLKGVNSEYPPGTSIALHTLYEPGSIIKMLTLAGAIEKGAGPEKLFPLQCEGNLKLSENKLLYDWKVHNEVKDIDTATAVSCNVSFARMGLMMKPADLFANLRNFGFDARLQDTFVPLDLGKILEGELNDLYLANISIGLEHLRMTPLHAAMVASAIANKGVCMLPKLVLNHRNLIGYPYSPSESIHYRRFMSEQTSARLAKAMEQVVRHEEGTGRRAAIAEMPFAMKTGTAGEGSAGYNAFIIGFAPLNRPRVAFAVVAEHCGKAEFEGARITRLFLESIRGYIQ